MIYAPKSKIAIASSFEGIVNDGAPECALVSFNAYQEQEPGSFFGRKLTAAEFNAQYRDDVRVRSFLALRPMVEVAEDYHTIIALIDMYRSDVGRLAANPADTEAYHFFVEKARAIRFSPVHDRNRNEFGSKDGLFYKERKALQDADYNAWLNMQAPFDDTLPQFRALVDTQTRVAGAPTPYTAVRSGLVPWFATSKDEASAYALCQFYAKVMKLDPGDVGEDGTQTCMITRDRIIGLEHTRDKVEQMKIISREEDIPRTQVWRLNDRYDPKQQQQLFDNGFVVQFFLPGYAAPHEIEAAKSDKLVRTLDRQHFAEQLAAYAEQWGF